MKGGLAMLVIISVHLSLLLVRQNQILENGVAGSGLGFGWVFLFYSTFISWVAVGLASVAFLLIKRK